jgi:hypothetical protein
MGCPRQYHPNTVGCQTEVAHQERVDTEDCYVWYCVCGEAIAERTELILRIKRGTVPKQPIQQRKRQRLLTRNRNKQALTDAAESESRHEVEEVLTPM